MLYLWERPEVFQFLSVLLLCSGILGLIYRRTLLGMLISVELIMNGAGLNLVVANRFFQTAGVDGQVFTLFVMGVAASEVAIALGIVLLLFKRTKKIEAEGLKELKG
ncbi:MAG: NADH-quinone oxidoreductase subunit NuoK [Deltaproteobacteria bacterium]|nr:MAG: NADH-quinone oxidoreductase subunit NuoK [Deltaproteobacteria bacterium]RLB02129.1 MAG: NADH-quinone oxidoreductase subunit NuoK [Deltaproteobacteria bacterium]